MSDSHPAIHAGTPSITVRAPVGAIRYLHYLRVAATNPSRLLISGAQVLPLARTTKRYGPRALADNVMDASILLALTGQPLYQHTVDGDSVFSLTDISGRALWQFSAHGTTTSAIYEPPRLAGRLLSCTEVAAGAIARVRDKYVYGPMDNSHRDRNLAGAVIRHNHNAGYMLLQAASLHNQPSLTTQFLLSVEAGLPDWGVADEPPTDASLTESFDYDSSGAVLAHTCASGVTSLRRFSVNGATDKVSLRYSESGAERTVTTLLHVKRDADGKVLSESAGNGVVDTYAYGPRTQRLEQHTSSRPAKHPKGELVFNDLHYTYDPTGHLLSQFDTAITRRWHRNRATDGLCTYKYDSLYRLASATGRERLPGIPGVTPLHQRAGSGEWFPYAQRYTCDDGGNLTKIEHTGQLPWTRDILVAVGSNRALLKDHGVAPEEGFLPGGLQKTLADGRQLTWYADGQLAQISPVVRSGDAVNDTERYHYADGGTRTRKSRTLQVTGGRQTAVTTYAGRVECRQRRLAQKLQLDIVITDAGKARLIENRLESTFHLRYSFTNHFSSTSGETDHTGNLTSREEYFPYGASAGSDEETCETTDRTRRYSGKERDATGLLYYGWRYYQPDSGRWLSADPGGIIDGVNLFHFCRNNPVNGVDDDGRMHRSTSATAALGRDESDDEDLDAMLDRLRMSRNRIAIGTNNDDESLDAMLDRLRGPQTTAKEAGESEKYAAELAPVELYQALGDHAAERYRFVVENFEHEKSARPGGGLIKSRPKYSTRVHYNIEYTSSVWTFKSVFRHEDSTSKAYFTSDVVRYQYAFISHKNGFKGAMPDRLRHENVLNSSVLELLKDVVEGAEIPLHDFMEKTDNGKLTQRILSDFSLSAVRGVKVREGSKTHVDIYVSGNQAARRTSRAAC